MISKRNAQITMDLVCGIPAEQLATKHCMSLGRIYQIKGRVIRHLMHEWPLVYGRAWPVPDKQQIGALIRDHRKGYFVDSNTPEGMYYEICREKGERP